MKKRVSLKLTLFSGLVYCTILTAALLGLSTTALAASWDAGDWKLSLGGNINAFYVYTFCDDDDLGAGGATLAGLSCAGAVDKNGKLTDTSSVQNGLLPASLNFSAATTQDGWDLKSTVNVYYGIDSVGTNGNSGGADALKFSTVDARQVYLTFGKKELGTVKMGRDFGLFAFDAIINDMTLLGVGAGFVASDPGHTSLGGLGYGYVYTDRLAQIDYSTPIWGGFQGTLGIFQGFDGNGANSADTPGFHAKASYSWDAAVKGTVSASLLSQDVVTTAGTDERIQGFDIFAKLSIADFSLLGYYYDAEGMTSLAIGGLIFPGFDAVTGDPEEVNGYMLQTTYTIGKVRLGVNWAWSEQKEVTEIENQKLTFGVYYNLTPALTLLAEYSNQESELKRVGTDESSNINVGAILFF
ncbi:MAG: porin [Pseudomonadota bacterium]